LSEQNRLAVAFSSFPLAGKSTEIPSVSQNAGPDLVWVEVIQPPAKFYLRFPSTATLDEQSLPLQTQGNGSYFITTLPFFHEALIDPQFSVVIAPAAAPTGLSQPALVAAIVVPTVTVVGSLVALAVYYFYRRKTREKPPQADEKNKREMILEVSAGSGISPHQRDLIIAAESIGDALNNSSNASEAPLVESGSSVPALSESRNSIIRSSGLRSSKHPLFLDQSTNTSESSNFLSEPEVLFGLEIKYEELTLGDVIAHGGYSVVYKAKYRGEDVAVKKVLFSSTEEHLATFNKEAYFLNALRTPRVVKFIGTCSEPPNLALVMELMSGSLSSLLRSDREISWQWRLGMLKEIAEGIIVLHSNKPTAVLHRDLKSGNILLDANGHCKISDFGYAVFEHSGLSTAASGRGTLAWTAPELFSSDPRFSTKSDIYSFGMIMWEVASRKIPYKSARPEAVREHVARGEREDIPLECPDGYVDLLQKCWSHEPSVRPSIDEIIHSLAQIKG